MTGCRDCAPLTVLTTADSWPARKRSGATTISTGHGSSAGALPLGEGRGHRPRRRAAARARPPGPAPRVVAATAAPSRTRWGRWWRRNRSLPLAGSPSAPLATTTGARPTGRLHRPPLGGHREPGAAVTAQAAVVELVDERAPPARPGAAPHWSRWSSQRRESAAGADPEQQAGGPGRSVGQVRPAPGRADGGRRGGRSGSSARPTGSRHGAGQRAGPLVDAEGHGEVERAGRSGRWRRPCPRRAR